MHDLDDADDVAMAVQHMLLPHAVERLHELPQAGEFRVHARLQADVEAIPAPGRGTLDVSLRGADEGQMRGVAECSDEGNGQALTLQA